MALLLIVLVVRAAVPTGFMFVTDSAGHLTLAACPGQGASITVAGHESAASDGHHGHHDSAATSGIQAIFSETDCGYAAAVSPVLQQTHAVLPGQINITGSKLLVTQFGAMRVAHFHSPLIARGPPNYS